MSAHSPTSDPCKMDCKFSTAVTVKYFCEGVESIDEMIACLKERIAWLEHMKADGWILSSSVSDGWAHLYRKCDGLTCACECCYQGTDDEYDSDDTKDENESVS